MRIGSIEHDFLVVIITAFEFVLAVWTKSQGGECG
jgi:hypothetical protein